MTMRTEGGEDVALTQRQRAASRSLGSPRLLLLPAAVAAIAAAPAASFSPPSRIQPTVSSRFDRPWISRRCSPCVPRLPTTRRRRDPAPLFRAARSNAVGDGPSDGADEDSSSATGLPTLFTGGNQSSGRRRIERIQKYGRLPIWPAWNGILLWIFERTLGAAAAARLEDALTGRVCPNFFSDLSSTSPFVLVVHHVHSFANYDPLRWVQSAFFPEGFPAHPHRGFVTLTYFLDGGFVHRDSAGCRQRYGRKRGEAEGTFRAGAPSPHHSQWLHTGAGILHEEMFDNNQLTWPWQANRHELFQIWINVPGSDKLRAPYTTLLGPAEAPTVVLRQGASVGGGDTAIGSETTVLAGSYLGQQSAAPISSPLCVYHVRLHPGATWAAELPGSFRTSFLYMRQGEVVDAADAPVDSTDATRLPAHFTAFFESTPRSSSIGPVETPPKTIVEVQNRQATVADFLFFAGEPLLEPLAVQGSMVMNTYQEINEAYDDYAAGKFGRPWDPKLSDDEWKAHVQRFPSAFRSQVS